MSSTKKDIERLVETLCRDHGCSAHITGTGHWRITKPGCRPVTASCTPRSPIVLKAIRADVRRNLGVDL